jgi:hypothetical protein
MPQGAHGPRKVGQPAPLGELDFPCRPRQLSLTTFEEKIMRTFNAVTHPMMAIVALAMLDACCGGASQMALTTAQQNTGAATESVYQPALEKSRVNAILALRRSGVKGQSVTPSFFDSAAKNKPLVFVSDSTANVVDIYLQARKNKMVGQITGLNGPVLLATDAARNLYVADYYSSTVPIYAANYMKIPKLILDDTGNFPFGVAVSTQGLVGVVNQCTAPSCPSNSSSVSFFSKNATTPCATIAVSANYAGGGAFDDKGNFYFDGANSSSTASVIGQIIGGCKAKVSRVLTTTNTIAFATSTQIDKADRLAILDIGAGTTCTCVIDTYNLPKRGSLGKPVSTTPLAGGEPPFYTKTAFAFRASGRDLFANSVGKYSAILEYDYPAGGDPEKTLMLPAQANPGGVAVTPPLLP